MFSIGKLALLKNLHFCYYMDFRHRRLRSFGVVRKRINEEPGLPGQVRMASESNQLHEAWVPFDIKNRDYIDTIEYYFNRKLFITCKIESPEKIYISRVKAQPFLQWLES
jgi:hypothetical protein